MAGDTAVAPLFAPPQEHPDTIRLADMRRNMARLLALVELTTRVLEARWRHPAGGELYLRKCAIDTGEPAICQACGRRIWFVPHLTGRITPYTEEGLNHFIHCSSPGRFRRTSS